MDKYIEKIKTKYQTGEPIFYGEIKNIFNGKSRQYVYEKIQWWIKNNELKIDKENKCFYLPENYYDNLTKITFEKKPNKESVRKKRYLTNEKEIYGIYGGLNLENNAGIITQIPTTFSVISNNVTKNKKVYDINNTLIEEYKIPYTKITKDNYQTYALIQLFNNNKNIASGDYRKDRLKSYIKRNNIKYINVLELAKKFPKKAIKRIQMSGVFENA